jgi:hypothetical protein
MKHKVLVYGVSFPDNRNFSSFYDLCLFFYLHDKPYWVSEKNNTAFFLRSKDNYVAQTFIFNEVQKVFLKVLFFIIAVFLEKRLLFSAVVYALLGVLSNEFSK